ncbi:MAG: hypothetical protein IJ636_06825 [Bacteroidales bacterium]|nr:hypothetical protein [Bacteroidales bacterium]
MPASADRALLKVYDEPVREWLKEYWLKPSSYLIDTAKRHIDGDVTIEEVKALIDTYYKSGQGRLSVEEERTEEADKVSARITELLQEETFSFTPAEYRRIHRKLFEGIFKFAGKYRNYNTG